MNFFDWTTLGTFAGCVAAVGIVTECFKDIKFIKKIPTQIFSYILAFILLVASSIATNGFVPAQIGISAINAAAVSLAANGGYEVLKRFTSNSDI